MRFLTPIYRFLSDDDGTTAAEYAVMLGFILLGIILGIMAAGQGAGGWWTNINSNLQDQGF